MRLNVTLERPDLYTYMKLGYSKYGASIDERDYADANLNRLVKYNNV